MHSEIRNGTGKKNSNYYLTALCMASNPIWKEKEKEKKKKNPSCCKIDLEDHTDIGKMAEE